MRIGIAQVSNHLNKEYSDDLNMKMFHSAVTKKCDLILFPELIRLPRIYKDYGGIVGGGYEEKHLFRKPYNTYELISDRVLLRYRKQNLFRGYDDGRCAGNKMPHCYIHGLKTYVCICYDIRFRDVFKQMTNPGLIIIPADFPYKRIHDWCRLLKIRAVESNCWVVGVNTFEGGHSCIVRPDGEIQLEANRGEVFLWEDIGW